MGVDQQSSSSDGEPGYGRSSPPGAPGDPPPPITIPEHLLLRCIGQGSYGQVWLARNIMGLYRAVKIVFRRSFENQRPFEREVSGIREFEPISRKYEGFVDILQVGLNLDKGYFYYIMEVGDDQVSGQEINPKSYAPNTLASEISRRGKLSLQECLRLGFALTQALAELHKHGLVHRDVKPSNIIFINGVPKLADIGLVAHLDEARSYVGTEGFIPPEGPGSAQADLYGLGKVLYEASTGNDRHDFPEMPAHWDESPDHPALLELNEVVIQACQPNPTQRYQSAWAMQADLLVVLNGKSVKRLKRLERTVANLKRIAGFTALALALLGAVSYQLYRERRAANEAHQRQVNASVVYGNRAMESGDFLGALPYFAEALRLDQSDPLRARTHRLRVGAVLAQCPKLTHMWFIGKRANDGEFSPDGKRVLVAEFFGENRLYDLESGELWSHPFGEGQGLCSAVFSPDGQTILTASQDGSACLWSAASLENLFTLSHRDRVFSARFSPDGRQIVTACLDGVTQVWDARTGRPILTLERQPEGVAFAAFSHNGQLIVTASLNHSVQLWLAANGQPVGPPLLHAKWVASAAFSPDDQRLVTACDDHTARLWEVPTGKRILPDLKHRDAIKSVEFSPDGRLLLTGSFDGTARLWSADDLQPLGSSPILRHGERLLHASFSPDGRSVVTTCNDGSVRIWDLAGTTMPPIPGRRLFCRDGTRFLTLTTNSAAVWETATDKPLSPSMVLPAPIEKAHLSRDGRFALILSLPRTNASSTSRLLQVLEASTGSAAGPGILLTNPVAGAALSDDAKRVVTWTGNQAQPWDVLSGTPLSPPLAHQAQVASAWFSPTRNQLLTTSGTKAQVWDLQTCQPAYPAFDHAAPVHYADFSHDGRYLVTCCSDQNVNKCYAQVWNALTGRPIGNPLRHADGVVFACFSADDRRVVTASEDFTAIVWETLTGSQLGLPLPHSDCVQAAAFSPDGQWVVTASSDKTARVWDSQTSDPLTPPLRHLQTLEDVKFLPDGRLVTVAKENRVFVWGLPVDQKPASDLGLLGQLLSGVQATSTAASPSGSAESPETRWKRLRAKYPADFTASRAEIVAWHEFQAEDSELKEQWFAAAFHLEHLLALRPDDASLSQRLAQAKENSTKKSPSL